MAKFAIGYMAGVEGLVRWRQEMRLGKNPDNAHKPHPSCLVSPQVPLGQHPVWVLPGQEGPFHPTQVGISWLQAVPGFSCYFGFRPNVSYIIWVSDPRSFSEVAVSTGEETKDNP